MTTTRVFELQIDTETSDPTRRTSAIANPYVRERPDGLHARANGSLFRSDLRARVGLPKNSSTAKCMVPLHFSPRPRNPAWAMGGMPTNRVSASSRIPRRDEYRAALRCSTCARCPDPGAHDARATSGRRRRRRGGSSRWPRARARSIRGRRELRSRPALATPSGALAFTPAVRDRPLLISPARALRAGLGEYRAAAAARCWRGDRRGAARTREWGHFIVAEALGRWRSCGAVSQALAGVDAGTQRAAASAPAPRAWRSSAPPSSSRPRARTVPARPCVASTYPRARGRRG